VLVANWLTGYYKKMLIGPTPWLDFREKDKRQHFFYSCLLLWGTLIFFDISHAFLIVLLIGLIKEIWDHFYGQGFCWKDMGANVLGSSAGSLSWSMWQWMMS